MPGLRSARLTFALVITCVGLLPASVSMAKEDATAWKSKVQASLVTAAPGSEVEFLVWLPEQATFNDLGAAPSRIARGRYVHRVLTDVANRTQRGILADLANQGAEYRSYWIANMIWVRGDASLIERMARRPDVRAVYANPHRSMDRDFAVPANNGPVETSPFWNLSMIRAPEVWTEGVLGDGAVIGCIDTGVEWQHPALIDRYRGWNGTTADHDYNWHDAIHSGSGGSCGLDSPEPCDDFPHGTPAIGIALGDDGVGTRIGVAPGARWIGCRCMDEGDGSVARYTECLEWMVAPTDLNGLNPDPALAPDVVNNSWVCTASEGCTDPVVLETVVANVRSAGIVVVASAGNDGPNCSSIDEPPATYDEAFTVGASDSLDMSPLFSSRGPAVLPGGDVVKPNVVAPGIDLTSSVFGTYFPGLGGTSFAAPHVAGAVALLVSANPALAGEVETLESILEQTAVQRTTTEGCGGLPANAVPNNTYGWGRLDVKAAYDEAVSSSGVETVPEARPSLAAFPNPTRDAVDILYELPRAARVSVRIYDARGGLVRSVLQAVDQETGAHRAHWDGRTKDGAGAPRGVYFLQLELDSRTVSRKLVVLQ